MYDFEVQLKIAFIKNKQQKLLFCLDFYIKFAVDDVIYILDVKMFSYKIDIGSFYLLFYINFYKYGVGCQINKNKKLFDQVLY